MNHNQPQKITKISTETLNVSWFPMGFPWVSHGFPMGFPLFHGQTPCFCWANHGQPLKTPREHRRNAEPRGAVTRTYAGYLREIRADMEKKLPNTIWIPVCGAYGGLYPNLSRINFLGPSFFRNKFPFPKKGTTPRRTWYTKNIQNQFWDHGGKHLWIKFQWPRSCLSLCKSPTNSAPRNSTLFFGCNPSVAEYFSMGQPP